MLKLMTQPRMLLIKLGLISVILSGCATSRPEPPDLDLYLHRGPVALCTNTKTGTSCPRVDIDQTNNWYMLAPDSFEKLQNYIDDLIRALDNSTRASGTKEEITLTRKDLVKARSYLRWLRARAQ